MKPKDRNKNGLQWLLVSALALALAACASIGRPEGGPRDVEPPVFVTSNPAVGALHVNRQRLDLYFNENVQLDDPSNKIIVSPAQKNKARVNANGRHITVDFQDTLRPNTTYTIDFGDAIKDLNEGNILDGFATYFSTGDSIDSLRISGIVLEARTLEPAQGMLVGVYSNIADSAIHTLPLERIARTNQYGQFTVHNLKPGPYRIYALKDNSGDFIWDRSEDVAFYDELIYPRVEPITVTDTLRASDGSDSTARRAGVAYYPNDILLTWFNEDHKQKYLNTYQRPARRYFNILMNAPLDSLPQITIASGPHQGRNADEWTLLKRNLTQDTLQYWITDSAVFALDSLRLSVRYQKTDSAGVVWVTDTLQFIYKEPKAKKKKQQEEADTLPPPPTYLDFKAKGNTQDVNRPVIFTADLPIDTIVPEGLHLELQQDTLWVEQQFAFEVDSLDPLLSRRLVSKWVPGGKYRFMVDSAAVRSIYGEHNKDVKHEFSVRQLEEYANLVLNITGVDSFAVVELLDKSDKPIATAPVVKGKASFPFLMPGTVYARLYLDNNNNGEWDTGRLLDSIQPEEVYYFPKKINLKKNWDITQDWDIYATAVDLQKPLDIKKNKPKLKKGEQPQRDPDDEDEDADDDIFGNNSTYSNSRRDNNRGNNNRGSSGRGPQGLRNAVPF